MHGATIKIKNLTRITCTLREDLFTSVTISHGVLLRIRNVPEKSSEKIKTHILCSVTFLKNRAAYEIMWQDRYIKTSHRLQYHKAHVFRMLDNPRIQIHTQNIS